MRGIRGSWWVGVAVMTLLACSGQRETTAPSEAAKPALADAQVRASSAGSAARAMGVFTVVSGESGGPVSGASVSIAGRPFTTDGSGQITAPEPVLPDQPVEITAAGFLKRETLTRSDTRFPLWPDRPGLDYFRETVYTAGFTQDNKLTRPTGGLFVVMGAGADGAIRSAHSEAAALLSSADGGQIPFAVVDAAPAGGATITIEVNGAAPFFAQNPGAAAFAQVPFVGNVIGGATGKITYKDSTVAGIKALAAHELGHHFGLGHPTGVPGLMNAAVDANRGDYSDAEKLAMRMMMLRRPGNALPDNDRAVTGAARSRGTLVFTCFVRSNGPAQ